MTRIRPECPEDFDAIYAIHASSFDSDAEALIVDDLRATRDLLCGLVAQRGGVLLGHVAVSAASVTPDDLRIAAVGPIAVVERCRRQGIGSALMQAVTAWADRERMEAIVLLGEPSFYTRFGFQPARQQGLTCSWTSSDAFQIRFKGDGRPVHGPRVVTWPHAFNRPTT